MAGNEKFLWLLSLHGKILFFFFLRGRKLNCSERDFFFFFFYYFYYLNRKLREIEFILLIYSIVKQLCCYLKRRSSQKIIAQFLRFTHIYIYIHTHVVLFYSSFEQTFLSPGSIETNSRGHRKCINTGRRSASWNFG